MNEDQLKSNIGSAIPNTEGQHPLHMLDNQANPVANTVINPKISPSPLQPNNISRPPIIPTNVSTKIPPTKMMQDLQSSIESQFSAKSVIQKEQEKAANEKTTGSFPSQKIIRTYESDVADVLADKNRKNSMLNMAVAEQERKLKQQKEAEEGQQMTDISNLSGDTEPKVRRSGNIGKKILLTLISLIFIGSGAAGGYYLYLNSAIAPDPAVQQIIKIPSLIQPDKQKVIMIDAIENDQLAPFVSTRFKNEKVEDEKVLEIVLAKTFASTTQRVTGSQFIDALSFNMPEILKRSLTDNWMLGIYSTGGQKLPFIALSTDFFQNAFAGMLKWEQTMPDELATILNYSDKIYTDDTSTTSVASFYNIKGSFKDKIIKNRDIREFINTRGEILFLYTFLNQNTMIITTSEATLSTLIDRIEKQTYIR